MPNLLAVFLLAFAFAGVPSLISAEPERLTREAVLGVWTGADTNGLSCRVHFEAKSGKVLTFREGKHITTVHFWWNIERNGTNIVLGVNGNAYSIDGGRLQLRLRPVNTNIATVRDARLTKAETKSEAR